MRRRLGEGWPSEARWGIKAEGDGQEEGDEGGQDELIPCLAEHAMGHEAEEGPGAASAGHLGVAWTSMSMASEGDGASWAFWGTLRSSWSALRLRLRECMGRDSWARSSMGGGREGRVREEKKDMGDHI